MFQGDSLHSIDSKGRIILPAVFREQLTEGLVITKGLDRCLYVFPMKDWEEYAAKIKALPISDKSARDFIRHFVGSASVAEFDANGRTLIPQTLRDYAGIQKDVISVGMLNRIEIWSREYYNEDNSSQGGINPDIGEKMASLGI